MFKLFRVLGNLRDLDENIHIIKKRFHYLVTNTERILETMSTKADLQELNNNLTEAFTEVSGKISELTAELEQKNQEGADIGRALELSRQLKDIVQNAPAAGEGQDTLTDGAGTDVPAEAPAETPEAQVEDQA